MGKIEVSKPSTLKIVFEVGDYKYSEEGKAKKFNPIIKKLVEITSLDIINIMKEREIIMKQVNEALKTIELDLSLYPLIVDSSKIKVQYHNPKQ